MAAELPFHPAAASSGLVPLGLWAWWELGLAWRLPAFLATLVVAWWVCFSLLLSLWLAPRRLDAPWPRDVCGRALALFWLLAWGAVLFFFAVVSDELRGSPYWELVIAVGVLGAGLIHRLVRHRRL
jgi:hypothetical protein